MSTIERLKVREIGTLHVGCGNLNLLIINGLLCLLSRSFKQGSYRNLLPRAEIYLSLKCVNLRNLLNLKEVKL